jgi:pilus assembly protein Flp/PilA
MGQLRNQKGQSLVEYMVIVALMAVGTMGVMRILSQTTNGKLAVIIQSLQGGKGSVNVQFERVQANDVRKKDMGDFFRGSRSQRDR